MLINVYLKHRKYDATGTFNSETKETIVKKGSVVSEDISTAPMFRSANSIRKLRAKSVENRILKKDISFKSPSSAANFVTGYSKNGYVTWKNEDGTILKDLL